MPERQKVCYLCHWPIEAWQDSLWADVQAWLGEYEDHPLIHANPADHRPTQKPEEAQPCPAVSTASQQR